MTRPDGAWVPDGRAKAIRADCEASLDALDGLPIDLYLVHAPDPRTPWRTIGARARAARRRGPRAARRRRERQPPQLDEALELAPIAAVQVALERVDDSALRGGVVERCAERGIAVIAHSPLGGPRRAGAARPQTRRSPTVAAARGATPAEVALAWLLDLSPDVVAIPGARRPETARSAARAAGLELERRRSRSARARVRRSRPLAAATPSRAGRRRGRARDGHPGRREEPRRRASTSARGYVRLNRDERGGSLRELADALDDAARRRALDGSCSTTRT